VSQETPDAPLSEETQRAVGYFYQRTNDKVLRFTRRLTRSPEDAEDVMIDAYADLACSWETKGLGSKQDDERVKYLRGIIRHRAADLYRARYHDMELRAGEMILQYWSAAAGTAAAYDAFRRADTLDEVCRAIHSMPPLRREAAALHVLGEWTYAEIAEELKISTGAVKQHMHKARRVLKRLPMGARALRVPAGGRSRNDR
jgi:RNA polymerase sigma-70 factor (ECF subfamily)